MMRVILWKELREQRLPAIVLTGLAISVLLFVLPMWSAEFAFSDSQIGVAGCFAWACGMVSGAILFANESESQTLEFLDALPRSRTQVWLSKFNVALMLTLTQVAILSIVCSYSSWNERLHGKNVAVVAPVLIAFAGLHGLGCGVFGSVLSRTVLNAIGWSLACLFGLQFVWLFLWGVLTLALILASAAVADNFSRDDFQVLAGIAAAIFVMPLPVILSFFLYTRVDRQRRYSARRIWRPQSVRPGWGVKSSLWLSFQQGKYFYLSLFIVFLFLSPLLFVSPWLVWPVLTLLLGTAAGVSVFADEQFLGSFRFLAEQRLPLGRIWWVKTFSRFFVAAAICTMLFVLGLLVMEVLGEVQFGGNRSWGEQLRLHLREQAEFVLQMGAFKFLASWFLYGLAFGHLAGMLVRKSFVAVAVSLMASAIVLSIWIPSLVSGGLHGWQFLALPIGMLVLARLLIWPWATDRLYRRRGIGMLVGALLLGLAWIAGSLAYRIAEMPAAPVPFDVASYEAGFPKYDDNVAGNKIRQAASQMSQHLHALHISLQEDYYPSQFPDAPVDARQSFGVKLSAVQFRGWPADDPVFAKELRRACDDEWVKLVSDASSLPPGFVEDPRHGQLRAPVQNDYRAMGHLLAARALQIQAEKKDHAAALAILRETLSLARHVQTRAEPYWYWQGAAIEAAAWRAMQQWAFHADVPTELLRTALAELQQHEQQRPDYAEAIKASYLEAQAELEQLPAILRNREHTSDFEENALNTLVTSAQIAPWEKRRHQRLLNAYYATHLQGAQMDYPALKANSEKLAAQYPPRDERGVILANFLPPVDSTGERALEIWHPLSEDLFFRHIRGPMTHMETFRFLRLTQLRGTEIVLALVLYQELHGQMPEKLQALVPEILPTLPIDPYSLQPFGYRISKGEKITWNSTPPEEGDPVWWDAHDSGAAAPGGMGIPGAGGPATPEPAPIGIPRQAIEKLIGFLKKGMPRGSERIVRAGTGVVWSTGPDGFDNGGVRQNLQPDYAGWYGSQQGYDIIFLVPNVVPKK